MKKLFKYFLLATLSVSLTVVSCTSDLRTDLEALEQKEDAKAADLQSQIEALQAAVDAYKTVVNPKLEELAAANDKLAKDLAALQQELADAIAGSVTEAEFQAAVTNFQTALNKLISDQKKVDGAQDLALQTLATRVETYKSDLETAIDTRIAALQTTINATINALQVRVKANEDAIKQINEVTIPALEARIKACEDNITALQTDLNAFKQATEDNLEAINDAIDALEDVALDKATYNAFISSFNTWKGSIDSQLTTLNKDVKDIQELIDILDKELAILKTDDEPGYITLQSYIEGIRSALQAQIDLLSGGEVTMDEIMKILDDKLKEKLSAIDAEIAILKSRVQSLVFVPQYTDLKFGIPFSKLTDGTNVAAIAYNPENQFEVVYKVAPDTLAESLAEHAAAIFTFAIEDHLQTRLPATKPTLIIKGAEGDNATGKIVFKLYHKDFFARIEGGEPVIDNYAISLCVDDEAKGIHVASEYTGTVNIPSPLVTLDMTNLYAKDETEALKIKKVYTKTTNEYTDEIEYIDSTLRYPYKDCFLAGSLTKGGIKTGPFSIDSLQALGYNVPDTKVTITTTPGDDKCAFLKHADLTDTTFATVCVDSTKALKLIKEHLVGTSDVHTKKLNYAFANGFGGVLDMTATITLGKANVLNFELVHDMTWTYGLDKLADHSNISSYTKAYSRATIEAVPKLVVGDEKINLDGSDKAYGIVLSDFADKSFTKGASAVKPTALLSYDYNVKATAATDSTITLGAVAIDSWGTADATTGIKSATYSLDGTYALPFAKTANATVSLNVKDRNRAPISLKLDDFAVTLLGGKSVTEGGEYHNTLSDDHYVIKSANLADSVYAKYVAQKIFTEEAYPQRSAFGTAEDCEFNALAVVDNNAAGSDAKRFEALLTNNTDGGSLFLASKDSNDGLTSAALRNLSKNYDADGKYQDPTTEAAAAKVLSFSFYSYIGQVVNLEWGLTAVPDADYKFTTYGALPAVDGSFYFDISPNNVWSNLNNIVKAKTELDLIKNNNIQIVTGPNGQGGIAPANFAKHGLVPQFELLPGADEAAYSGKVEIVDSDAAPKFHSNVKFYSQEDSVTVGSALYIKSNSTLFYVPGSDKMFVNYSDTQVPSVTINKFNPIADSQTLTGNVIIVSGSKGLLPLTLKDRNFNDIYLNGKRQDNKGNYAETVKNIFGAINVTLVSVDGIEAPTGWSIFDSATPERIELVVPAGLADGVHTVVVKVNTIWTDVEYTFQVGIGKTGTGSGIDAGNQDYGQGGNETWN